MQTYSSKSQALNKLFQSQQRQTNLIIDLDGTLIYTSSHPIPSQKSLKINYSSGEVGYLYIRPGTKEFLEEMQKIANLYVYTYSFYTTAFFLFAYLEVPLTGVLGCGMQRGRRQGNEDDTEPWLRKLEHFGARRFTVSVEGERYCDLEL